MPTPETPASGPLEQTLAEADPEIARLIAGELARQRATLDLVASETVPPRAVLDAQGSVLTAKYADGYPHRRQYDTCEWVDEIEALAIERARSLFSAEHANVQPYSGENANRAVLQALCNPGDAVLAFDARHGGHPSTFAGRYDTVYYGVGHADRLVDMDQVRELALRHRPRVVIAGWSCYPRFFDFAAFRRICDEVGAFLLADMAHFAGLVAAGVHPDPVPLADACTMTVHKTLGGARGGAILCRGELAERVDAAVFPGEQGGPLVHVLAAKAVTFAMAATEAYRERMAATVEGARLLAGALAGAEAATGASVVTGGTDVHQLLVDLAPSGRDANEEIRHLNTLGISANAIPLPFDPLAEPAVSGLRFGSVALAARGFRRREFAEVGDILVEALRPGASSRSDAEMAARVAALAGAFPLYPYLP